MNFKFEFFAIFIAFALRRIEAVEFENDAGSSRRRLIDAAPVEQPTFSPVDIRIPIGFFPEQKPSKEQPPAESEPVQTETANPTHDDSPEITDSPTSTPSMPPVSIKPIENELDATPEDRPTQGSNWCPTYFSGNGNACGSDVLSDASWIQCAYSESNHLQTCVCSESDPFWRCKSNKESSDEFVIVTTRPYFDSEPATGDKVKDTPQETQTEEPKAPVENPVIVTTRPYFDSEPPTSDKVKDTPQETQTEEPNAPLKNPTSEGQVSSSLPQNDSTGMIQVSNPSSAPEMNTTVTASSPTTSDDTTEANEIFNPSPTSDSNTTVPAEGFEPPSQSSSEAVNTSLSTTPDDPTESDALDIPSDSDPNDGGDMTESPSQASKGPGLPSPALPHVSTETERGSTNSTSTDSDSNHSDDATISPSQAFKATSMPSSTPQVDSIQTDKLLNPSPTPEANTSTSEIPDESTSKANETSLVDEEFTATDSPLTSNESDIEPVTERAELPNTNSTPSTDVSKTISPSAAHTDQPVRVPSSAPIPMSVEWSSKETEIYQIASPVVAPSIPPSPPTIFLTQKLPPGIFASRPTKMPTAVVADDTSACEKASSADRRILVFRYLRSISGDNAFDDVEDPAFMAASWISDEDPLKLCPGDRNFTQRYVLALLYFYTSGDNWKRCTRYSERECFGQRFLSDHDECSWGGVTCDSQNRVTKLNLGKSFAVLFFSLLNRCASNSLTLAISFISDENNLSGSIPQELSYLENLFELDFDSNNLIGHFPSWVGAMKHLERLDLDRNILSGPIPEELYTSTSLKYIDMDRNILSGTISSNIGTMSQLIFFQVDFNQLIGTIPTEIANIKDLQYFSVFGNGFDESVGIPFEICGFHTQIYANCEMCEKVGDCCTVCLPADLSDLF